MEIDNPQVTIIEMRPNTTAVYHPLDKGLIAMVKRRYMTRLLRRVIENLHQLLALGHPLQRVPRGGRLDQGGQVHLLDAVRSIVEEWVHFTPLHIANYWLTADVMPDEAVAEVRRQVQRAVPVADKVHTDVRDMVALLAKVRLATVFGSTSGAMIRCRRAVVSC